MIIPAWINPKYLAMAGLFIAGLATGWVVNGWRLNGNVAELTAEYAKAETEAANAAIADMIVSTASIKKAADEYVAIEISTSRKIDSLRKEVRQYAKDNPLPADCKPDATRVRKLADGIAAANEAATR